MSSGSVCTLAGRQGLASQTLLINCSLHELGSCAAEGCQVGHTTLASCQVERSTAASACWPASVSQSGGRAHNVCLGVTVGRRQLAHTGCLVATVGRRQLAHTGCTSAGICQGAGRQS